jgi:hypothetical protein
LFVHFATCMDGDGFELHRAPREQIIWWAEGRPR